jgi:UDP-N-acetylmuramate dehydrogenase
MAPRLKRPDCHAMNLTLPLQTDFSLRRYNSFGIDAKAGAYLRVEAAAMLAQVRQHPYWAHQPRLILGGGSNLLLTADFDGLVLHLCTEGIELVGDDADATYVRVAAGENWHRFVQWSLRQGLGGLENLSLIPGSVGAAPIQNIGAYGVELSRCFHQLSAFDFDTGEIFTLDKAACAFGYRDSVFKHQWRGRAAILDVTFAFPKRWQPVTVYAELAQQLMNSGIAAPGPQDISDAVIAIRRRKLPDPAQLGNAGSFFKNPLVSAALLDTLQKRHPQLVSYPQADGSIKLAAGWLIDQCGWKGRQLGAAGVYEKQALVLVNRGGASGADVVRLATAIEADVWARFGVRLEPEPVFVP